MLTPDTGNSQKYGSKLFVETSESVFLTFLHQFYFVLHLYSSLLSNVVVPN